MHHAPWPDAARLSAEAASEPTADAQGTDGGRAQEDLALAVAADVLREVRKAKSEARRPMRAPVAAVLVCDTAERLRALDLGVDDRGGGAIQRLTAPKARSCRSRSSSPRRPDRVSGVTRTPIEQLPQKIGERVTIRGRVHAVRDQKRVQFVIVRDETGLVQVVLEKSDPPSERASRSRP